MMGIIDDFSLMHMNILRFNVVLKTLTLQCKN